MSTSTEEEEFRPLPSRIRLNPHSAQNADTKVSHKRLPVEALKPTAKASNVSRHSNIGSGNESKKDLGKSKEEEANKSKIKSDDSAEPESQEGPFGGSTKYYLIFLAIIFGTLLLVWMIGGQDDVTMDYLDQQYSVLGLDPSAGDDQVKSAFKKLAMKFHPDKCRLPDCAKQFIDVEKARDTILKWGAYFRARRVVGSNFAPQR